MKNPNGPYVIELDADGLNTDLAPGLVAAARAWPTYRGTNEAGEFADRWGPIIRCGQCDGRIHPDDLAARVGHLTGSHGYRMDGRRFDNANQEVHRADG